MTINRRLALALSGSLFLASCASNLQMGLDAGRAGNYQAMLTYCKAASEEPNPSPEVFECIGDAHLRLGHRKEAEQAYLTYLDLVPNDTRVRKKLIQLYMSDGRHQAAQPQVETLLQLDPGDPEGYYWMGEIHRLNGICKASVEAYKKALSIRPDYFAAKAGLEKVEKEVCGRETKPKPKPKKPRVIKEKTFRGGGAVIKEGQW
ncbi:MAG: hypothetical protein D6819_05090 [Gammaproteobacteria bacterium]|nr:MAG: hypothetical protein D6819_05090 [Gammaproteobacteria bacterium]